MHVAARGQGNQDYVLGDSLYRPLHVFDAVDRIMKGMIELAIFESVPSDSMQDEDEVTHNELAERGLGEFNAKHLKLNTLVDNRDLYQSITTIFHKVVGNFRFAKPDETTGLPW